MIRWEGLVKKDSWLENNSLEEIKTINEVLLKNGDMLEYTNHMFFVFSGLVIPIFHFYTFIDLFKPKFIDSPFVVRTILGYLILSVGIVVGLIFYYENKIENHGYINCKPLDTRMTFSTYKVYTRDMSICERLYLEKQEEK